MSDSLVKIYVYAIWTTKNKEPLIHSDFKDTITELIQRELEQMNCRLIIINSSLDRIHCLFSISSTKSISFIIKQIKGSSSRYINLTYTFGDHKFEWQIGYAAFSVSELALKNVCNYIKNKH